MRRWVNCLAMTAGLFLPAGCTTTRSGGPFADSGSISAAPGGRLLADTSTRRAGKPAGTSETAVSPNSGLRAGDTIAYRNDSEAPQTRARAAEPAWDADTFALIQRELSDATPDEREALLAAFEDLPSESIERILRARRMGLISADRRREPVAPPPAVAGRSTGAPAANHRNGSRNRPKGVGLGSVDAWGQQVGFGRGAGPVAPEPLGVSPTDTIRNSADAAVVTPGAAAPRIEPGLARLAQPLPLPRRVTDQPPDATVAARGPSPVESSQVLPAAAEQMAAAPRSIVNQPAAVAVATTRDTQPQAIVATAAPNTSPADNVNQVEQLIAATEAEIAQLAVGESEAETRHYIERQVHLRMLYLIAGRHERALQVIPGIGAAEQEFWQQMFWGLTNYFDAVSIPAAPDRATQAVSQFSSAVLRLQEKANLELRNVNFCHRISSFGNYEKYPRDEFGPGQEVLLYAEVANIHSEPTPDGKFRTSLRSTLEIYQHGSQGELVERIELPETVDVCGTHRRDYFHSYQFTIPGKLTLGPHVLKLTVEDQLGKRQATYSTNFMVK